VPGADHPGPPGRGKVRGAIAGLHYLQDRDIMGVRPDHEFGKELSYG
jgi:hypothetical protein